MALTRSFKDTVQARVQGDPAFRAELLREAVDALLAGDLGTGKAILRDYINATGGFEPLGAATGTSGRAATRRRATSSPSSATCRTRRACSCRPRWRHDP